MQLSSLVQQIETDHLKKDLSSFSNGAFVCVDVLIQEGNKQRTQSYTGTVIRQHRAGLNSTITVRRLSKGVGVERIFPIHSPDVQSITPVLKLKK